MCGACPRGGGGAAPLRSFVTVLLEDVGRLVVFVPRHLHAMTSRTSRSGRRLRRRARYARHRRHDRWQVRASGQGRGSTRRPRGRTDARSPRCGRGRKRRRYAEKRSFVGATGASVRVGGWRRRRCALRSRRRTSGCGFLLEPLEDIEIGSALVVNHCRGSPACARTRYLGARGFCTFSVEWVRARAGLPDEPVPLRPMRRSAQLGRCRSALEPASGNIAPAWLGEAAKPEWERWVCR